MAKYEFGIMENAPVKGKRYDEYEPQKYPRLIYVYDDDLDPFLPELKGEIYWHTLDVKADAIAMAGINLIPPETCLDFAEVIKNAPVLSELERLLRTAHGEGKFVILFGL